MIAMSYPDITKARADVSTALGFPLSDALADAWTIDLGEVAAGHSAAEDVAARIKTTINEGKQARASLPRRARGMIEPSALNYEATVSSLLAAQAGHAPLVQNFRDKHLSGGLVGIDEVPNWITSRAGAGPTKIKYADGMNWKTASVPPDGPLADLSAVVRYLSRRYPWGEDQAVAFVLTGLAPFVRRVQTSVRLPVGAPSAATRIHIEVDPAATPGEVADSFKRIRTEVLGGRKPRRLGERHLAIALFQASRPESETWAVSMEAWNEEISSRGYPPEWRSSEVTNYARDARSAINRLLYPAYGPPSFSAEESE